MSKADVLNIEIPLYEYNRQAKYGKLLSSMDQLIEYVKEKSSHINTRKSYYIRKILKHNSDSTHIKLGDVATFKKGKGISKNDITDGGIHQCIRYADLFTKYGVIIDMCDVKTFTNIESSMIYSNKNMVLMPTSDVTPTGLPTASAIVEDGIIVGGDILIIETSEIHPIFLAHIISNSKNQIIRLVSGTTVFHIYEKDMEEFYFTYSINGSVD